jgi:hypothetical protein
MIAKTFAPFLEVKLFAVIMGTPLGRGIGASGEAHGERGEQGSGA